MTTLDLHPDVATLLANDIYAYIHDAQFEVGECQTIELSCGANKDCWLEARVDIDRRELYEKGDYLTPDYVEVEYTNIGVRYDSAVFEFKDINGKPDFIYLGDRTIKDINRELAKLCE